MITQDYDQVVIVVATADTAVVMTVSVSYQQPPGLLFIPDQCPDSFPLLQQGLDNS